jgi:hypothetical protein
MAVRIAAEAALKELAIAVRCQLMHREAILAMKLALTTVAREGKGTAVDTHVTLQKRSVFEALGALVTLMQGHGLQSQTVGHRSYMPNITAKT